MEFIDGKLLVASKDLRDPNFARTVVFMVQHSDEGALGLILNQPTNQRISDIWAKTGNDPCENPMPLYQGGPVPGPLMALHQLEEFSEQEVIPGVHFTTHRDALDALVRQDEPFRLFVGHSGWGGGQLEGELSVGGWLVTPAEESDLFRDPEEAWKVVTNRIGMGIMLPKSKFRHLPGDSMLN